MVANGPANTRVKSTMMMSFSGPSPAAVVDGCMRSVFYKKFAPA